MLVGDLTNGRAALRAELRTIHQRCATIAAELGSGSCACWWWGRWGSLSRRRRCRRCWWGRRCLLCSRFLSRPCLDLRIHLVCLFDAEFHQGVDFLSFQLLIVARVRKGVVWIVEAEELLARHRVCHHHVASHGEGEEVHCRKFFLCFHIVVRFLMLHIIIYGKVSRPNQPC